MLDKLFRKEFIILDGAMGTMLQRGGLKAGQRPELLSLTHGEAVAEIHRAYLAAGSDIIYANTFGASAYKLQGCGYEVEEVITASINVARRAAAGFDGARVALDIGPIGELVAPTGTLSFEQAYGSFKRQVVAGEKAGADLVVFETMTDLHEARAAVLAARENTSLPIFVTMTFEENGRTFAGCPAQAMAELMDGLGVDAMGVNCSLGPGHLLPIMDQIAACTDKPLILKPNAGLPDARTGAYSMGPEEFGAKMAACAARGVQIAGGCCGTTPDFIAGLREALAGQRRARRAYIPVSRVCSATRVVTIDRVRMIGERINPTGKKRFQRAVRDGDFHYILTQAVEQAEAGTDILDVNVGVPGVDEASVMARAVREIQGVVDLPLQIDSNNPTVIEAGLRAYGGKAIVNSVNGQGEVLDTVLPLVKKYGAAVVGLTMDSGGIPCRAKDRVDIARRILAQTRRHGIRDKDVYIDCLTLTVSAQQEDAMETLKAMKQVKEELGLRTVLGVSNISFGLPNRELVTRTFLTLAMGQGLDLPIINPNQPGMVDTVSAFHVLNNTDRDSEEYIARFHQITPPVAPAFAGPDKRGALAAAVARGLKEETRRLTLALLEEMGELEIIDSLLIPALDAVGERFEEGEIFLPQLMKAADASREAFEVIKTRLAKAGAPGVFKGKIILATVKGDIHDIGKNIVKTILVNYGYEVIDLGRDVPPEAVVEAAVRENVRLVGLSALMTTTLDSMENTIRALRASGHDCKILVGGAVLTADYAAQMGADYYARDAKQAVDIARKEF